MATRNLAAYAVWILALVAILMPPAFAEAGLSALAKAQGAVFSMLDDPAPVAVAETLKAGPVELMRHV